MERSDAINELASALCEAQGDFPNVPKDANNPFFKSKYADLASIVDTVRPVLKKHGLSFSQLTSMDSNIPVITTMLIHKSGQFISSTLPMPAAKVDAQGIGSAITYGRRYGLQAILGLAAEDDDGNAASHGSQTTQAKPKQERKQATKEESFEIPAEEGFQTLTICKVDEPTKDKKGHPFLTMLINPINKIDMAFCWKTDLFETLKSLEKQTIKVQGIWMSKGFCINKIVNEEPF